MDLMVKSGCVGWSWFGVDAEPRSMKKRRTYRWLSDTNRSSRCSGYGCNLAASRRQ